MNASAVGGYFELELPAGDGEFHRDALRFQSSRAAFLTLLRTHRPSAVWMPWYICESMLEPLRMTNTPVRRYELDDQYRIRSAQPAAGEWLLYVNYFGLNEHHVDDVLKRFPRERVVIDNAQAFFAQPRDCFANLYSPRKFFGVPDGGYLVTSQHVEEPLTADAGSVDRSIHLLKRLGAEPEAGYSNYLDAEEGLRMQDPKRMSALTRRILSSVDYASARARRKANFAFLHERLARRNLLDISVTQEAVPLCYPFRTGPVAAAPLREAMVRERIYTPNYWPDVAMNEAIPRLEKNLSSATLFLPCDQRLTSAQLERMSSLLLKLLR